MSRPYVKLKSCKAYCWNCVKYARSKVPSLPYGLWTLANKIAIINTRKAKKGNVAIIRAGAWGHVAVVKKVGSRHITIKETNYRYGRKTERHSKEKDLNILGYYSPKK